MNALIRQILFSIAAMWLPAATMAQHYPSQPIRIVVPFPPGGISDNLARALAERLSPRLQQPVLVDNRPGANTIIGAQAVTTAKPDGYTLLMATDATMSVLPYLYEKLPFNPVTDLMPISVIAQTTEFLIVSSSVPANTVAELVQLVRAQPGTMSYGSQGLGSNGHLAGETFRRMAGLDITHVPYKGLADVVTAMLGNHTQMAFASVAPMLQYVRSGKLKPLAVISPKRSAVLPNVPTIAEAGYPELESMAWFGLVAPTHTPHEIIDTLSTEVRRIVSDSEYRQRFIVGVGLEPVGSSPDEFAEFLKKDREKYAIQVRNAGVKLE